MEFGICTGFSKERLQVPHLAFIKDCGFAYLELSLTDLCALTDLEFAAFAEYLQTCGLPVRACNCFVGAQYPLTGEKADLPRFAAYVKKAVGRATTLGVQTLVLGSGGARNVPPGFSLGTANHQLQAAIDCILAAVTPQGITLALEHLNRQESNLLTSFSESAAWAQQKGSPYCKSVLDYFHFSLGNEDLSLVEKHAAQIGHVHFARPLGRTYPSLLEMGDFAAFFAALKAARYQGAFSMECAFPEMEKEPPAYKAVLAAFQQAM